MVSGIRNTTSFATAEENEHLSALEQEKARLENAVKHLQRSNAELAVALAERGPDADFDKRRLTLMAAIGAAVNEMRICVHMRSGSCHVRSCKLGHMP